MDNILNNENKEFAKEELKEIIEMEYLIELCGFEIVNIYGDYYETPATNNTLIWVLKKKVD